MRNRGLLLLAAFWLGGMLTSPAQAHWRDYLGKTLVVEVDATGQTLNDVVTARGGATATDDISPVNCRYTYHAYVSLQGRLFVHVPITQCTGMDRYVADTIFGQVYDLNRAAGMTEPSPYEASLPYEQRSEGDELILWQPQTDHRFNGDGYVSTTTNSSGGYTTRIRFAPDCTYTMDGESRFRSEFDSTTSDFYSLSDIHSTFGLTTRNCQVVDGFVAR